MKNSSRIRAAIAVMALFPVLVPTNSLAYSSWGGARVAQVTLAVFEVVPRDTSSGSAFWCGASDYARRTLGAGWSTPIYIARGLGPSVTTGRRSAVQFTLDPAAAGVTVTGPFKSRNSLETGESMSVQQGNLLCEREPTGF